MTGHDDDGALPLPRNTTPTWEVELLISGVAVFAMLQLPELLDRYILDWYPRLVDRWAKLLFLVYVYAKSAALILAVTAVASLIKARREPRARAHAGSLRGAESSSARAPGARPVSDRGR